MLIGEKTRCMQELDVLNEIAGVVSHLKSKIESSVCSTFIYPLI
ncbi:MAG: hypothetical protein AB1348_03190 [Nitrospirota bacterium]